MGWRVDHCRPALTSDGRWMTPIQGDPGFPDLVLARTGRVVFAELKPENSKLTLPQEDWLKALYGQEVAVWRPNDIQYIAKVLRPGRNRRGV